jgi:hypothetical protein
VKADLVLEPSVQMLEFSYLSLCSHGDFSVLHLRCLMKCVKDSELILVVQF